MTMGITAMETGEAATMNKLIPLALALVVLAAGCTITVQQDNSSQAESGASSETSVFSTIDESLLSENDTVEIGSMI